MASSRDDFIIAIRSAFLKKSTQQKFSLLTLVFLSIFVIILSNLDFKVIRYLKEIDPFEAFVAELIGNIDLDLKINRNTKRFLDFIDDGYDFIDDKKDINMISYCFECEFFIAK